MDFSALFAKQFPVPPHALIAIAAVVIGAIQLLLKKGTQLHRITGYVWVACMGFVAFTGLFIHELRILGPFSPIHFLSVFTLYSLWSAVRAARRGDIDQHRRDMKILYVLALIVAGIFTFLPGRAMHAVLFGG